jgi:diguanylate cyclase (GGDEF)-like protein/PAS domain S-box-containing protein
MKRFLRYTVKCSLLAAGYFGAVQGGLAFAVVHDFISLIWPASGLALVALTLMGLRYFPALVVGGAAAYALHGLPLPTAAAVAAGNTLAALAGAWLLERSRDFDPTLGRVRDVFRLIFPIALGTPVIAACVGAASLLEAGLLDAESLTRAAITWWAGDAQGVLLFAPFVFAWIRRGRPDARVAEALAHAALIALVLLFGAFVLEGYLGAEKTQLLASFALFPLAIWPAVRFPMREVATFNLALAVLCLGGAWLGIGPFVSERDLGSLVALHGLLGAVALTTLLLGALSNERRTAAAGLAESETRFRSLTGLSADWYWEQDESLRFTLMSAGLRGLHLFEADEYFGKRRWDMQFENMDSPEWAAHRRKVEAHEPFRDFLLERCGSDGRRRYALTSGEPVFDAGGRFRGYRGVGHDVTAQKQAEAELRASRELFARIFDDSPTPMMLRRLDDGVVTAVNDAWCALYGRTRDAVIGQPVQALALNVDLAASALIQRRVHEAGAIRNLEVQVHSRDGEVRDVLLSAEVVNVHGAAAVISTTVDVTERNRAAADLAASRERFERLFRVSPLPIAISGVDDGAVLDVNDAWTRAYGYTREEILGRNFVALGLWTDLDARRRVRDILRAGGAVRNFECRWRRKSGEVADVLISAEVVELGGERVMLSNGIDVTEQRRAEAALRATQARFAKIFQSSPVPVVISRLEDGRYVEVNDAWLAWSGHTRDATIGVLSVDLGVWLTAADRAAFAQRLHAETAVRNLEARMRKRSGEIADVLLSVEPIELGGEPCIVTSVMDITERKRAERQLRESERRFRDFAEAAGEYVWELDVGGRFTYVSQRVEQVTGYSPEELLGRTPVDFMPAGEAERVRDAFTEAARERESFRNLEHRTISRTGSQVWQLVSGVPIIDSEGRLLGYRGTALDITERKQSEARISELATRDPLTNLPNRLLLSDRLARGIANVQREGASLAVMFIDLDHFKRINDTHGHEVGDGLLREVAKRIGGLLRKGDTLARLGGDEFVVVLEGLKTAEDAGQVAQKIINLLSQSCEVAGHTLNTAGSIGIAICPTDGMDSTTLMRHADTAMYVAKSSGRKNYQFFSAEMNVRATERLRLEAGLKSAVELRELRVFYQPRADIETGTMTGAEALLRWQHPDHGLLVAGRFLPLIEETGLIHSIGEWVLRIACEQAQGWHALNGPGFAVSVNISPKQFNRALLGRVRTALDSSGLEPRMLELELTEVALARNPDDARPVLSGLRALGVRVVVDDFGTGYSSMSQLRRFAIDGIKIDRSFVRGMLGSPDDRIVVKAMIDMARSLRINTIAEGVESDAELELLKNMGCEEYSGHLLAEAGSSGEFERRWLRTENVFALRPRR